MEAECIAFVTSRSKSASKFRYVNDIIVLILIYTNETFQLPLL